MGAQSRLKRVEERRCLGGHSGVSGKMGRCTHAEFSKLTPNETLNSAYLLRVARGLYLKREFNLCTQTPSLLVCFQNKRALAKWLGCIILLAY